MSERDGYAPGVPCWVATWRADAEAAVGFYAELFGWEAERSGAQHVCRLRGRDVAAIGERAGGTPAWTTYVWVENAEATAAKAAGAGGSVVEPPSDAPGGGRVAVVADPADAAIGVWQPGSHRGAPLVNEPGA